jgi:hypothetical protein
MIAYDKGAVAVRGGDHVRDENLRRAKLAAFDATLAARARAP